MEKIEYITSKTKMGHNDKVGWDDEDDKWCGWKKTTWMKDTEDMPAQHCSLTITWDLLKPRIIAQIEF